MAAPPWCSMHQVFAECCRVVEVVAARGVDGLPATNHLALYSALVLLKVSLAAGHP